MENSLGVSDPQTVFLREVSPVKTPIRGGGVNVRFL